MQGAATSGTSTKTPSDNVEEMWFASFGVWMHSTWVQRPQSVDCAPPMIDSGERVDGETRTTCSSQTHVQGKKQSELH